MVIIGGGYARRLLGHANISTTQRYAHLDDFGSGCPKLQPASGKRFELLLGYDCRVRFQAEMLVSKLQSSADPKPAGSDQRAFVRTGAT